MSNSNFTPGHDGPRFEIQSIGRSLADLPQDETDMEKPRGPVTPALVGSALALVAMLAFIGWLLVGLPPH